MLTVFRRLLDLLTTRERRRFWFLCVMILGMGLLEMAGIASILPFLAVLSNPTLIESNARLAAVYQGLRFTSTDAFLLFLGGATFAVIFFGQLFKAATNYAISRFVYMRDYSISSRLLGAYLHQPYAWFLGRHSADLGKTILSEVSQVTTGVMMPAMRLLAYGTIATMLILFLCIVHPMAALGGALLIGSGYTITFLLTRRYLGHIGAARVRANKGSE